MHAVCCFILRTAAALLGPARSVTSTAVEETVADVQAARVSVLLSSRARLLAELFNSAALGVGVAGTSGKSTTVGMLGWISTAPEKVRRS